jgi:hypothetical protein
MKNANLRMQLEAFAQGRILNAEGTEDFCFNFYDWFCRDTSLKNKAVKLFAQTKRLVEKFNIDAEKHYVYFANRCPMYGKLYDQLSIVNIETGDVEYCLAPRCGHTGMTELWFKGKTLKANGIKELYKLNIALAE